MVCSRKRASSSLLEIEKTVQRVKRAKLVVGETWKTGSDTVLWSEGKVGKECQMIGKRDQPLGAWEEVKASTKEVGTMTDIGFDHHKKWTQAAALADQGKLIGEGRVLNDRSSVKGFLKEVPNPWTGVVEAGPTWGWIYDTLSELGVKRIVANPSLVRGSKGSPIRRLVSISCTSP